MKSLKAIATYLTFIYLYTLPTIAMAINGGELDDGPSGGGGKGLELVLGFIMISIPAIFNLMMLCDVTIGGEKEDRELVLRHNILWVIGMILMVGWLGNTWPADYSIKNWFGFTIFTLFGAGVSIFWEQNSNEIRKRNQP